MKSKVIYVYGQGYVLFGTLADLQFTCDRIDAKTFTPTEAQDFKKELKAKTYYDVDIWEAITPA